MADLSESEILFENTTPSLKEHFLRRSKLFHVGSFHSFSASSTFFSKQVIRNPANSGVNLIVFSVIVNLNGIGTTNQLNFISVQIRKNPVFSSLGTLQTILNLKIDNAGPNQAEIYSTPTVTTTGDRVQRFTSINKNAKSEPFVVQPGEDINVRCSVNDINITVFINTTFAEDTI